MFPNFSWLDGKHVVFGEVLEGYEIVDMIENVPKGARDRPAEDVKIVKSGELEMESAEPAAKGSEATEAQPKGSNHEEL